MQQPLNFAPTLLTLRQRSFAFHLANPSVYHALKDMAREVKRAGHEHYSIAGLFEVLRFRRAIETRRDPFLLNNDFRSFYSRELMLREPDLAGFFTTRSSKVDA